MPTPDLDLTRTIVDAIRDKAPDLIINISTAIAPGLDHTVRIGPVRDNLPQMASFNTASMNFALIDRKDNTILTETVFENTFGTMGFFVKNMLELKIKPEFEIYDLGGFYNIRILSQQGKFFDPPHHYQLVFGVAGGVPFNAMNFAHLHAMIPKDGTWSVCGVGREQIKAGLCAAANGGHIRVGLEDNTRTAQGEMAKGSYEQVTWAVGVARAAGREVATAAETKEILSIPERD